TAVRGRRRAYADQRELGSLHGPRHVCGDRYPAARCGPGHKIDRALLDHRRFPGADEIELGFIDIHTDNGMAVPGKAAQRDRANVAETENADFHLCAARHGFWAREVVQAIAPLALEAHRFHAT